MSESASGSDDDDDDEGEGGERADADLPVYLHALEGELMLPTSSTGDRTSAVSLPLSGALGYQLLVIAPEWRQLEFCTRLFLSEIESGELDHAAPLARLPQLTEPLRLKRFLRLHRRKGDIYTCSKVNVVRGKLFAGSDKKPTDVALTFDASHRRLRQPHGSARDMLIPEDSDDEDGRTIRKVWFATLLSLFEYKGLELAYVRYFDTAQRPTPQNMIRVWYADRPQFSGMKKSSAGYGYIGTPWYAVVEVGHLLHAVHLVPDLPHYVQHKTTGKELSTFWLNKHAFLNVP